MSEIIAVIMNAKSGCGNDAERVQQLESGFHNLGLNAQITLARDGHEIIKAAKHARSQQLSIVVAGGGDGTINAVASELIDSDIKLGVLPLGTLNHFAKDLRIPLELEAAIQNVASGQVISVDVGTVNGQLFLNNSSVGLYPTIVRHREKQQQQLGRGKWPAFFWATLSALKRYPFIDARLTVDGVQQQRRTPFIFVGNNRYLMSGFDIGSRAALDQGQLSLYVGQRNSRWGLLGLAARALCGNLLQARDFDELMASEILVDTRHTTIRVATDGEVNLMTTPLHYRIHPGALKVIAPRALSTT